MSDQTREVAVMDDVRVVEDKATWDTLNLSRIAETLASLQLAIDTKGWKRVGNAYDADGLSIESLQQVSDELRSWIVGGGILKRIVELRGTYAYGDGIGFKNLGRAKKAFLSENNVAKLFSVAAMQELNRAHGSDGTIVFLVHNVTKDIIRVPFDELGAPFVDSDDPERIWYIRRTYTRATVKNPSGEKVDRYFITNTAPAVAIGVDRIPLGDGTSVAVNHDYTAVVWKVNGQVGWPLGIPDLLPALQWAEKYTNYLKGQDRFAEALAMIAWHFKAATTDQAKKTQAAVRQERGPAGSSMSTSGEFEAKAMPGNQGVSFDAGQPLAAQAAAAGEVPVDSLLGKSATSAGGNLDPDLVRAILARRDSATRFFKAIGALLGAPKLEVVWPDVEKETPFREAQMMIAAWGTGMFESDELRPAIAAKLRIELEDGSTAPSDVYPPNSTRALKAAASAAPKPAAGTSDGNQNSQGHDALGVGKTSDGDNTARDKGETN